MKGALQVYTTTGVMQPEFGTQPPSTSQALKGVKIAKYSDADRNITIKNKIWLLNSMK
jgi:hypothetical protein